MSSQFAQLRVTPSESELVSAFIDAMSRVYLWMTGGLLITAVVATFVASSVFNFELGLISRNL